MQNMALKGMTLQGYQGSEQPIKAINTRYGFWSEVIFKVIYWKPLLRATPPRCVRKNMTPFLYIITTCNFEIIIHSSNFLCISNKYTSIGQFCMMHYKPCKIPGNVTNKTPAMKVIFHLDPALETALKR